MNGLLFTSDSKYLISGGDRLIRFWSVLYKKELGFIETPCVMNGLALNQNEEYLASCSHDKIIRIYHLGTLKKEIELESESETINELIYNHNNDNNPWNFETSAEINLNSESVLTIYIHYKNLYIALADNSVVIWNLELNQEIGTLKHHSKPIKSIIASQTLNTLCIGSEEIKLWDLSTLNETGELIGHCDGIIALCVSDDEKTLISAGRDQNLKSWIQIICWNTKWAFR